MRPWVTWQQIDPTSFTVTDISKTSGDGLARVMRKELKKRGITHLKVVYSTELPHKTLSAGTGAGQYRRAPGERALCACRWPGLICLASQVVKDLLAK